MLPLLLLSKFLVVFSGTLTKASVAIATTKTVSKLRRRIYRLFVQSGVPDPAASAKYLLAHCIGQRTITPEERLFELNQQQRDMLMHLCERRLKREPLQYILGEWDFRDVNLTMRAPVFIPRPETEKLVDLAVDCGSTIESPLRLFCEVCTGSGAVTVCLLRHFSKAHCLAVELLPEACQLTLANCARHGVDNRLHLVNASLATHLLLGRAPPLGLIVGNPPYVPDSDMRLLQPEVTFESPLALRGGRGVNGEGDTDGLGVILQLMNFADARLASGGWLAFEMDATHGDLLRRGYSRLKSLRLDHVESDFSGRDRFCLYRKD